MKTLEKKDLETKLRIYAQVKDYTSAIQFLKDNSTEIDINSKDLVSKETALDILLKGENSFERNETILLFVDEYGAQGLSEAKRRELLQEIEESKERRFDSGKSIGEINIGSPSSSIRTEDGRISPDAVANLFGAELSPNQRDKNIRKQLSEDAKALALKFKTSKTASPIISIESDQVVNSFADEEKHIVKEIVKIDLTGYEEFTPEHIIENDLIAKAALQGELTVASSMVNRVINFGSEGAEEAIKNGLSEMITAFPDVHRQADEPRDAAFMVYNGLKKRYDSISDMTIESPEVIAIISASNFQKSVKRLPERAIAEDLKNAQEVLRSTLPIKVEEARLNYQEKKNKVAAVTQNFAETMDLITDRINLSEYKAPKLDQYSAELKDIVVNAMEKNKKKFAVSKNEVKGKPKATKTISDFDAKKNVANELPSLSNFAQDAVTEYHQNFSQERMAQLTAEGSKALDRIIEETANKFKEQNPEFNKEKFKLEFYDLTESPIYSKACEEVFKLHQDSQESKDSVKFYQDKKQKAQDVVDEIKADLVPMAIKLQQLNDQLDPEDRLDTKNLHTYVNAVFTAQLKQHLPEEKLDLTLKNKLSQSITNEANKKAYEYSEQDLQRITDPREEMQKLLSEVGLKPKILERPPVRTEEQKAIAEVGKVMSAIGMRHAEGNRPSSPSAAGLPPKEYSIPRN